MDNALEQIPLMSRFCELHVMIELSQDSLKSTVFDFSKQNIHAGIQHLTDMLSSVDLHLYKKYFTSAASVTCAYYPCKRIIGISNLKTIKAVLQYFRKNKISILHFDTISARLLPGLPILHGYKTIATIHDPVPHKGEETFKKKIITQFYKKLVHSYLFYSAFAAKEFLSVHKGMGVNIFTAKLLPYTYITQYPSVKVIKKRYILFFGRISYYKGIDLLLSSIESIFHEHDDLTLVIAGKAYGDTIINKGKRITSNKVHYLNRHLSNEELRDLIQNALFVICPYREATQSGVLMTALAMKKVVLATDVGSFPEYIVSHKNGLLVKPATKDIADGINLLLNNDYYKLIEKNLHAKVDNVDVQHNISVYDALYSLQA